MDLVRSLEDVHKLFTVENRFCVEQAASWLPPTRSEGEEEELAAPLLDGYKVSFHLGDLKMSQICELYNLTVDTPHDHCKMLVLHLVLDEEQVVQLKGIDEAVKVAYRETTAAMQWIGLVRTYRGVKTLPVDLLLEAEAPTQIWFNTPSGVVEGQGLDFLLQHIGSVDELKGYACNVVLEFDWITRKDESYRQRVKVHSAAFKKKMPANRTLKRSAESVSALYASNVVPRLSKRR